MLLAVDIGNTNIVFGVFDGDTLLFHFRVETRKARTEDEYAVLLHSLFALYGVPFQAAPAESLPSGLTPSLGDDEPTAERSQRPNMPPSQLAARSRVQAERGISAGILATVVPPVLAAFQTPLAIGTDTGGSIRQPAALTATVGVKPTYGTVSRYGLIACASSLDQGGPCARTVLDTALLHEVIAGHDPRDSTSVPAAVPDVVAAARAGANGDLSGVRVGVVSQLHRGEGYQQGVLESFNAAVEQLRALGAQISEVDCPHIDHSMAAYYLILPSEVSSNLARFDAMRYGLRVGDDGTRSAEEVMALTREVGFGPEVKRRIMIGTYALSAGYYDAYYNQAQKVRTLIADDLNRAYESVDVLISPTTPTTAFRLGEKVDDPLAMYLFDLCTLPLNLAGHAGMSVPSGLSADDGLPVGLQIMAPALADDRLYRVGAAYEVARGPVLRA